MTNNDIIITSLTTTEKVQEQLDALQADVDLLYDIIEVVSLADDLVEMLDDNELPIEIIECVSKYKKLRSNIFEDEEDDQLEIDY
jgi:hypothetical protein